MSDPIKDLERLVEAQQEMFAAPPSTKARQAMVMEYHTVLAALAWAEAKKGGEP